jgi:hypothetical protein
MVVRVHATAREVWYILISSRSCTITHNFTNTSLSVLGICAWWMYAICEVSRINTQSIAVRIVHAYEHQINLILLMCFSGERSSDKLSFSFNHSVTRDEVYF